MRVLCRHHSHHSHHWHHRCGCLQLNLGCAVGVFLGIGLCLPGGEAVFVFASAYCFFGRQGSGLCSHHSHHLHIPHNHHWHHRHHRHHFHLAAIVATATSAITNAVNVVYNAVAGALCNLGQAFMDSVVRATVVGIMEIGKTVVLAAGKVVAMGLLTIGAAMDKVFSVQRIYYAGSLAAAARGNFGTLEIDLTVFSTKLKYARCPLLARTPPRCLCRFRLAALPSAILSLPMQLEGRVRHRRHDQGARYRGQGCRCSGASHFQVEMGAASLPARGILALGFVRVRGWSRTTPAMPILLSSTVRRVLRCWAFLVA